MKTLAIVSLVLGLGGVLLGGNLIMGGLALLFGFLALNKADKETKIFAISGIVLGFVVIAIWGMIIYQTKQQEDLSDRINEAAQYLGTQTDLNGQQ